METTLEMMCTSNLAGKRKALVVGLGRTGLSCARYLAAKGAEVSVVDSRDIPPMYKALRQSLPQVSIHTGGFNREYFHRADFIVVSPGISLNEAPIREARDRGVEVIGDVELFLREIDAPVLAITGSNGKSTVTALVGEMCRRQGMKVAVAGNIGVPVLDLLCEHKAPPDCFVLELSSFQLESTSSLRAQAAALLNLSEDHMDRYPAFEAYMRAKGRIFAGDGIAIVNRGDLHVMRTLPEGKRYISFGSDAPPTALDFGLVEAGGETWLARGDDSLLPARLVPLAGRHNLLNVLAAMAVATQMSVGVDACIDAVAQFQGLPHRMELILEKGHIRWINDSKATNVGAAVAALNGLSAPIVLIAGGDSKAADFSALKEPIARQVRGLVLLGRDAGEIKAVVADDVPTLRASSMREAVELAKSVAQAGDTVLLAPACASFDMYLSFEQRGEHFTTLVGELV